MLRPGQDTVDFSIYLTPAGKYSFTQNFEGSRNQSAISGNLFGFAVNLGLQNRNFAKAANQANTILRYGIETGRDTVTDVKFTQTRQLSLSHTIYFPRPIPNTRLIPAKFRENFRTVFSFNAATTERRALYNLTTVNGAWGYETQWKNKLLTVKIPNIEYSFLRRKPLLDSLFKKNPSLKNVFTDGFISSLNVGFSMSGGKKKNINLFRANFEESGMVAGFIKSKFLDTNLYRFIRVDAEFVRKVVRNKTALVLRLFGGVGYEFKSTKNEEKKNNLPFFKQYLAGGPNSMRAWALRKLGQGSTIRSLGSDGVPERYGDVQLEGNIEYRFPWFVIQGVKVNGALFTDFGNIWYLKSAPGRPTVEIFDFNRLSTDIAVGAGVGLRVDFSFLVIRLDYAYKVKDPSPQPVDATLQNKWFGYKLTKGDQFQLGISYPFIL
jgi:outer membrane protein assembly factor BamA